ncbi:MAG: thiamine phosphate synthase [Myxococcota bacterium]
MKAPRLLWITPPLGDLRPTLELARALPGDVAQHIALLLRRPKASGRALAEATRELASLPVRRFVQRLDLALAFDADGVHLPERGLRPSDLPTGRFCIGASRHDEAGVAQALAEGADYVTLSPVFASPGKGTPLGVEAFRVVASRHGPLLGLGGVLGTEHASALASAGAHGTAAIRGVHDRASIEALLGPFVRPRRRRW